jgi:DNA-binding NarL/FixJ family response regulator
MSSASWWLTIIQYSVSHEGWEVCGEACDGREAVEKCRLPKPDLLILDICMPKLNGVDAARQILEDNPAQRILVLTNVGSEQVVRDRLEAGVRGWFLSPMEPTI